MKNKILLFFLLLLLFFGFVFINFYHAKPAKHKIIRVVEADEFYIDLNDDNFAAENEHFKLEGVVSYKPFKNKKTLEVAKSLGLSVDEYLKAGFCSRNWAFKNLYNKFVYIDSNLPPYNKDKPIRYIKVKYNNTDLGAFLLKSGLAYVYKDCNIAEYMQLYNLKQTKLNAKEISKVTFYIVNLRNDVVHKIDCKYAQLISNAKIISKKSLDNYKRCSFCFLVKNEPKQNIIKPNFKFEKSINKNFGDIELLLINPLEFSKPNKNCKNVFCKTLIREINSAKNTIDIALYGMGDQKEIYEALLNAKKRGVKIRSVVDYSKNMDEIYPFTRKFIQDFNSVTDKNEVLMHNKFFIFDDKKVLTGSANVSSTDSGGYNANNAVLINSSNVASIYKDEFEKMYNSKFSLQKQKSLKSSVNVGESVLNIYFSPSDAVLENALIPAIKNAKSEIFVSIFYLTDKNLITELINAKKRNVNVMVLLDSVAASNFKDRVYFLRNNSIPVIVENWGGKNHEKTIVIDSKILILGSCNFSKSGFYKNDENVVKILNPKIASFYREYYLFLFNSIDKKFLHYIPRAEGPESKNSCFDGIDNNYDGKKDSEDEACRVLK